MNHVKKHLQHMLTGERTNTVHATDSLIDELRAAHRDPAALREFGRDVLQLISDDLKAGLRTQKALHKAMKSA